MMGERDEGPRAFRVYVAARVAGVTGQAHPDILELNALYNKAGDIVNDNAMAMMQTAIPYTLLDRDGDLRFATKRRLYRILKVVCEELEDELRKAEEVEEAE
jgi:hypothetical protein